MLLIVEPVIRNYTAPIDLIRDDAHRIETPLRILYLETWNSINANKVFTRNPE